MECTQTGMLSRAWTRSTNSQPKQTVPAGNGQKRLSRQSQFVLDWLLLPRLCFSCFLDFVQ
jgi:hypothetical protein